MDKLAHIFQRQSAYIHSLRPTYEHNRFGEHAKSFPWDLDDRHAQEQFRLLAWRCTEEVIEASETLNWNDFKGMDRTAKYREEVADALHFFIELCLVSGVTDSELRSGAPWDSEFRSGAPCVSICSERDALEDLFEKAKHNLLYHGRTEPWPFFIRALGLAMFELRQRPWRTDYRQTNRGNWVMGLHLAFQAFINACSITNIDAQGLHEAYFGKAKINDQRIADYGV